jgi:hypothetical protein
VSADARGPGVPASASASARHRRRVPARWHLRVVARARYDAVRWLVCQSPPQHAGAGSAGNGGRAARRWAALLQKIIEVDPLACPPCGGLMWIVACITQASVIDRIPAHLGTRTARAPHAGAQIPPSTRAPETRGASGVPHPSADALLASSARAGRHPPTRACEAGDPGPYAARPKYPSRILSGNQSSIDAWR